jgi:hypothetical protein
MRRLVLAISMGIIVGCASSPYELPPPTAATPAADEAEDEQTDTERDLAARAALLELYEYLNKGQFVDAEAYLSQQTREFLVHASDSSSVSSVLANGQLTLADGRSVDIDPVEFLIAPKITRIADSLDGVESHQTARRRELFVYGDDDGPRRVIMIREGDQWVLHKTSISHEPVE